MRRSMMRDRGDDMRHNIGNTIEHLRAVCYHTTPPASKDNFTRQLDYFAAHYESIDEEKLARFLDGTLAHAKPLLIISFDDGMFDNYEVAAPLLEARNLVGWFFIPADLPALPPEDQHKFFLDHHINLPSTAGYPRAMNWAHLQNLASRGHVIGCHTKSHMRMQGDVDDATMQQEIFAAKQHIEARLGKPVESFAWVGGEPHTYNKKAYNAVVDAGFSFIFTTQSELYTKTGRPLQLPVIIHRTVLDADMPYWLFRAKAGGLSDILHKKRRTISLNNMGV
jgi:peptidoglycan/xylan/chitin deacetylase (PgdA/CDA1 family)